MTDLKRCPPQGSLARAIAAEIRSENLRSTQAQTKKNSHTTTTTISIKKPPVIFTTAEVVTNVKSKLLNHLVIQNNKGATSSSSSSRSAKDDIVKTKLLNHLAFLTKSPARPSSGTPVRALTAPASPTRSPNPRSNLPMPFMRLSAELAEISSSQIKTQCDSPRRNNPIARELNKRKTDVSSRNSSTVLGSPSRSGQYSSAARSLLNKAGSPTRIATRKDSSEIGLLLQQYQAVQAENKEESQMLAEVAAMNAMAEQSFLKSDDDFVAM